VREEFNRAEALQNDKRAGTVGFALTILQRRLASSPEAIYQSLRRRRERLESRLRELELLQRGGPCRCHRHAGPAARRRDVEDLEEAPENEVEAAEEQILDQATAARTIAELKHRDRDALKRWRRWRWPSPPQRRGHQVARAGQPARRDLHPGGHCANRVAETDAPLRRRSPSRRPNRRRAEAGHLHRAPRHAELPGAPHHHLLGRPEAVVTIHGGMGARSG
jgi:hypothetical protein